MRLSQRRKVDLPQPDGPIRAVIRRGGITSETSAIAGTPGYETVTPCASKRGSSTNGSSVGASVETVFGCRDPRATDRLVIAGAEHVNHPRESEPGGAYGHSSTDR